MIYGSVCSGIEAATAAWHVLGWQPAFFAEIDTFPSAVLKHQYPRVPNLGDFTTIKRDVVGTAIDLLVGGTPCQSFSVAGLRGGLADDRGNLALEYLRLADRLRPRWLVWENVPGVLSSNGGRDFGAILGGMVELGYGFAYRVLDAQHIRVDGFARAVPQRRRRVFVVGHIGDWRRAAAVLFERASLQGDTPPRRQAGQRTAGPIAGCSNGGGANGPGRTADDADSLIPEISVPLLAKANDSHPLAKGARPPTIAFSCKDHGADAIENLSPTLRPGGHTSSHANAGVMPAIAFDARQSDVIHYGDLTGPIDTDGQTIGVVQNWRVRRLTPLECERLQGFPDGYTDIPYRGKSASDGPRYKALGNSMAVNCMRWIGKRIEVLSSSLPADRTEKKKEI